ncbi:MAG: GlxA family transcriptional regulator [Sphingomonadales bacterium]|nr:GlxA family transcriptional regulator [Sphingomonadales bacterium]
MKRPQHIVFALVEEFTHIAFACGVEPLRIANLVSGQALYSWTFASADGRTATASNGAVTLVNHGFDSLPRCDRLLVISGINVRQAKLQGLIAALRRARSHGTPIGALCSGAYVLAKAGFLDGMAAAVHWEYHDGFMEEFPDVNLVRNVFVADQAFVTASGGTAAADLMLHLIEREHGYDLAVAVADQMVYNAVRGSTAEQRVSLQSRNGIRSPHLISAIETMRNNLHAAIAPAEIAANLGISTRQLERLFVRHLNTSPKKYFMEMRLERARHLLLQTENGITDIALACGFTNVGHFGRVYRAAFGVSPARQRARMPEPPRAG